MQYCSIATATIAATNVTAQSADIVLQWYGPDVLLHGMYHPCSVYLLSGTRNISAGDWVANSTLSGGIDMGSRNGLDGLPTSTPYTSEHHATVSESGVYTALLTHVAQNCCVGTDWAPPDINNSNYVHDVLTINVTLADSGGGDSGGGNSGTGTSVSYTNTVTPGDGYYYRALLDTSATNPAYCRTPVAIVDTPSEPGTYYYRAVVTDDATTYITNSANATLEAVPADTTSPVITLTGDASCSITVGDTWTDPGATATDNVDASVTVTSSITLGGQAVQSVDTSTAGTYTITYSASDAAGNAATPVTRTVAVNDVPPPVTDTTPPVITLTGDASIMITVGDTWTDPGATATDNVDASVTVTSSITLGGQAVQSVDTSTAGTYTITYSASDAAGNAATPVTRTVTVAAASGSGSDSGDSGSGSGSGSGSNSGSGSGGTLTAPMAVEYHTTVSDNIPPNVPVWFRAVVIEPASGESSMASGVTNADRAWLTQPKTLRAIYDSNVLCLWRSGMTLSNSSRDNCFRARLEIGSGAATRVLRLDEIESIVYTIEQLGRQLTQPSATVAGHASVTIPACPWVLQNPITDTFWNADTTGYNFAHWPDSAEHFPFPTPGFYEVQYTFTTTGGQRLLLVFKVNVS